MHSLIELLSLLGLYLALTPLAFQFSMGCCCGSNCGDPLVDCCTGTYPTSFDVTLPDDWTSPGGLPCTNCENLGGNTYTVTLGGVGGSCLLGSGGGSSIFWNYKGTAFCDITANKPTCNTLSADLAIQLEFTCDGTQCKMTCRVALGRNFFLEPLCCSHWEWFESYSAGSDCDVDTRTLDYDSGNSFQVGCCSDLFQCDIAATPGQITVVKT